jgi:hypothetical protein
MALFSRSPEERLESMEVENEVLTHQKEMAEKRAVISELKKKYGPGWRKLLGGDMSLSSLKSFLGSSNAGMRKMYSGSGGGGSAERMRTMTNMGSFRNASMVQNMPSPLPPPNMVKG